MTGIAYLEDAARMTYSIVARCPRTGQLGVGAVTAMLGVGKLVVHAETRTGAAASQAFMNPYLAMDGIRLLADGGRAEPVLAYLTNADPGKDGRQWGLVDRHGGSASWTGRAPEQWAGHRTGENYAAQGNRLAGPEVIDEAVRAFVDDPEEELVIRLLRALREGEKAGGDTKGHLSASIYIVQDERYPLWDLRIDHAEDPLRELEALHDVFRERLLWQIEKLPTRNDPQGKFDFSMIDDAI